MRQRARHEQIVGIASSGIEYKMTREREPPPSYHRHPRRCIKLTAHITSIPVRRAEGRNGKTGAGRQSTRQAERRPRHRTIRPQAMNRPTSTMTARHRRDSQATQPSRANRSRIANERERESGTVRKQAGRPPPCPQPQIDRRPHIPRPAGGGLIQAGKSRRTGKRG